jgi:hypothetical protein
MTTAFSDPGTPNVSFYWIDSDNTTAYQVTYTATLSSGNPITAIAFFHVAKPTPVSFTGATSTMNPVVNVGVQQYFGAVPSLNFGYNPAVNNGSPGVVFNVMATTGFGGSFAFLQLISVANMYTLQSGRVGNQSTNSGYVLDDTSSATVPQYNDVGGILDVPPGKKDAEWDPALYDVPAVALTTNYSAVTINEKFQTFLMYKPPTPGAIWVTMAILNWHWAGTATATALGNWGQATASSFSANPQGAPGNSLPTWGASISAVGIQ